jgi:hypothetical protein
MPDLSEQIRTLLGLVPEQSRIVFFVGAGVSVGAGYPLWKDATKQALEKAEKQGLETTAANHARTKLLQEQYYQVFGILQDELPTATFHNIAQTVFSGHDKPCQTHHLLTKVKCRGVITTNFDNCLEEAAIREGRGMPLQDCAEAVASDKFFVARPHGSISVPRTMVLSTSDWRRVEEDGGYRNLLAHCVGSNQFVFLDYSMRDPDFNRMWDQLLQERTFRSPAIYCCAKGNLADDRREAFRSRNVQVLEFVDDGSFAFINRVLEALAKQMPIDRSTKHPITTEAERIAQELERYVLISLLFSPAQQNRLVLVAKALILEFFVATVADKSALERVFRYVTAALGQDSLTIRQAVEAAIQELGKAKLVQSDGSHIEVDRKELTAINEEALRFDRAQSNWVRRALAFQSESLGQEREANDSANIDQLLEQVLMESGRDVAELFLFNRPPRDELAKIEDAVNRFCKEKGLGARQTLYKKTITQMVLDPGEEEEDILFKKLQSYFIASAYVLDPTSERLLSEYAKDHCVYFDSSVILPALAAGHPSQKVYKRLLSRSRALGMRLRVTRDMANEVWANIRSAAGAFREFERTRVSLQDVLQGYVKIYGPGNGNVFLEGLLDRLGLDPKLTPAAYMGELLGVSGGHNISEEQVATVIAQNLEIECDDLASDEINAADLEPIVVSIEHLRKQANRFKTRKLCEHEARQFYLVHLRRKQNPELSSKIWFVTTDRFLVELQRLEKDKYPLPISYTPRSWFQYLDLIDVQSRGSQNFSRLQPRMRFGVVSGDLGIEAIHTILKERKDLLSKGIVTVKELAEAAVRDYHVRQSIWDYDKRSGSTSDPTLAAEAVNKIQRDIKQAVSQFVAVRVQEVEKIKSERDAATAKARALEKKLAKEKHVARTLRARRKNKPKKRGRR